MSDNKEKSELAEMFTAYIDIFYGRIDGDAVIAYNKYAKEMENSGYCPMTYYEDGRFCSRS